MPVSSLQFFINFGSSPFPSPVSSGAFSSLTLWLPIPLPFLHCLEGISIPLISGLWHILDHLLESSSSVPQPGTLCPLRFQLNCHLLREAFCDFIKPPTPLPTSRPLIMWSISPSGPYLRWFERSPDARSFV